MNLKKLGIYKHILHFPIICQSSYYSIDKFKFLALTPLNN